MAGGPFPSKNVELNSYFDTVTPYLNTHNVRLKIAGGDIATLNSTYSNVAVPLVDKGWVELWAIYSNDSLVNKGVRAVIKTRKAQMKAVIRTIYDDIPASALTEVDRTTLNLPERDTTPTEIMAVDFAPVVSFEKVSNNIQLLRFQNPETPDSNAMPKNQSVELYQYVGVAGLADNDIPFEHAEDTGKHLFQVDFAPEDKGKTSYYRARYETNTGKTGPWSDVQSEIVL